MSGSLLWEKGGKGSLGKEIVYGKYRVWKSGIFRERWEVFCGWRVGGIWGMKKDEGGRVWGGKD